MREHARAVFNELRAVLSNGFAVGHVVIGELLGGAQGEFLFLGNSFAGDHCGANLVECVHQIHGGGARGGEGFVGALEMPREGSFGFAVESARALGEPIRGGGPDGAGAAHGHIGDGAGGLIEIFCAREFEGVREFALLDEDDFVGARGKGDGAVMTTAALDADVHLTPRLFRQFRLLQTRRFLF